MKFLFLIVIIGKTSLIRPFNSLFVYLLWQLLGMRGLILIILMKLMKTNTICNRRGWVLFLFSKHYLKEIKPLWCILLHVDMLHMLQLIGWEVLHCCKQKTPKQPTTWIYIRIYNYHYYIVGNNCDGTLYSQEIVRIKKVYNKEERRLDCSKLKAKLKGSLNSWMGQIFN